jgi:hypothetical protein
MSLIHKSVYSILYHNLEHSVDQICPVKSKSDFKKTKNLTNQNQPIMKKFFYTIVFTVIAALTVSACTEETIQPLDGGTSDPEKCQFGGPNCPK